MNLNITGHHIEVTPAIREYVTGKLERVLQRDRTLERRERIQQFLCQPSDTLVGFGDALDALQAI